MSNTALEQHSSDSENDSDYCPGKECESSSDGEELEDAEPEINDADETVIEKKSSPTIVDKEKIERIWDDFKKDTEIKPKGATLEAKPDVSVSSSTDTASSSISIKSTTPTPSSTVTQAQQCTSSTTSIPQSTANRKRSSLESILSKVGGKKQKVSTLQQSLSDWKSFKKEEGIEEDLENYNRGKGGYIERQTFLQRADLRTFEVERAARMTKK